MINYAGAPTTPVSVDDYVALQRLAHRYADAVVNRDVEQWGSCWADAGVWDLGGGRNVSGKDSIVNLWIAAMAGMDAVVQVVHNGDAWTVADQPGKTFGRWHISERFRRGNGDVGVLLAHYDDSYVSTAEGWKFASRFLQPHYHGSPDLSSDFLNTPERLRQRAAQPDA